MFSSAHSDFGSWTYFLYILLFGQVSSFENQQHICWRDFFWTRLSSRELLWQECLRSAAKTCPLCHHTGHCKKEFPLPKRRRKPVQPQATWEDKFTVSCLLTMENVLQEKTFSEEAQSWDRLPCLLSPWMILWWSYKWQTKRFFSLVDTEGNCAVFLQLLGLTYWSTLLFTGHYKSTCLHIFSSFLPATFHC